jgi:HEAT repeat protein
MFFFSCFFSQTLFYSFQVAYVLGQLQNKAASAALCRILRNANEHPMVRHEAAEALGSIAGTSFDLISVVFL